MLRTLRCFGGGIIVGLVAAAGASAQQKTPGGAKPVAHDITITADAVYTGKMLMAIDKGKVSGDLHLTVPTEIRGKVAGTSKAGVLTLEFPFTMVERNCEGTVKMNIKLPAKPGPASGTMEALGCGREPGNPIAGTVELTPEKAAKR